MTSEGPRRCQPHPGLKGPAGPLSRDLRVEIGMHDLAESVHAGVGTPRAGERHLVAGHRAQLFLKDTPHGSLAGLGGKAVERGPVVGN